ncbi:DMT family transporter [Shewanella sp. 202IG2-18]|uniref:DMT family transporter n=1 Tax=Parashewanella hymeniacidonis TaxID=2807618 RepID=UPI001960688C|nr:DMT family transporter [Parashewanella hymeniacidonis]MBM7073234.1 DMT family transporter [Parashewanella hymeniacidonis]
MTMIILALLNGILIGLARTLNGRLGSSRGAFLASFVNHFVGFVFLTIMLWLVFETPHYDESIPTHAYLGGIIGALYVAVNSFVLHKVGAVTSILCVLSGQMLASLMIDMWLLDSALSSTQILGILCIFAGMYLTLTKKQV